MAEKERIIKEKIEHSGLFDFQGFYGYAHSWLKDEGYGVIENKYSEKMASGAREITIEWEGTKQVTDYFKITFGIRIDVKELVDVEAEIDGKKKKMNKGKISVEIKGDLIRDPENKWDNTPFSRFMRGLYDRYIIPAKIEENKTRVATEVQDFKEQLKSFLDLTAKR